MNTDRGRRERAMEKLGWRDVLETSPAVAGDIRFLGRYFLPAHGGLQRRAYESELGRLESARVLDALDLTVRGRLRRLLGRAEPARADFSEALRKQPSNALARAFRAEIDLVAKPQAALSALTDLLKDDPGDEALLVWTAYAHFLCGQSSPGLRRLDTAALPVARHSAGRILRGILREREGNLMGAESDWSELIRFHPRLSGLYTLRAATRIKRGQEALAVEDAHQALDLHPENIDGFVRILQQDQGLIPAVDPAIEKEVLLRAIEERLARDPRCAWAHAVRAALLGRSPLQLEPLKQCLRLGLRRPWIGAFLGRALGDDSVGQLKDSLQEMNKAVRLAPKAGWILSWRAEIHRKLGDKRRALADLDDGIRLDGDYKLALAWRSMLREQCGDKAGAVEDITSCLEALDRPSFRHRRALLEWSLGENERPLEDLNNCLSRASLYGLAYAGLEGLLRRRSIHLPPLVALVPDRLVRSSAWLGRWHLNQGRIKEALSLLTKAVDCEEFPARAWLGEACYKNGRWRLAVEHLEKAVERVPGHLLSWLWRSAAWSASGNAVKGASGVVEACRRFPSDVPLIKAWVSEFMPELDKIVPSAGAGTAVARAEYALIGGNPSAARRLLAAGIPRSDIRGRILRSLVGSETKPLAQTESELAQTLSRFGEKGRVILESLLSALPVRREIRAGAHWLLSRRALRGGRLEEAQTALARAVELAGPLSREAAPSPILKTLRAAALRRLGDFNAARLSADEALKLDKRCASAYAERARVLSHTGSGSEALGAIRQARRLEPDDADFAACEGDLLRRLGRVNDSFAVLDKALKSNRHHPWCLILRGELARLQGEPDRAWNDIRAAVERDANGFCPTEVLGAEPPEISADAGLAWAYCWRAGLRRRQQLWTAARADLDRSLRLDPGSFWTLAWRGELLLSRGEHSRAKEDLQAALALYPGFAQARTWLGRVFLETGEMEAARREFSRARKLEPADVWALLGEAACDEKSGFEAEARRKLEKARVMAPDLFAATP